MNVQELASDTVTALAPALPFLVAAGKEAAKEFGKKTAAGVMDAGRKIWNWLEPHAQEQPALMDAAREVAAQPEDQDAQAALRLQIRKLLEAQPQLARELGGVIVMSQIHVEGKGNIVAGGDINAGDITITNN